MHNEFVLEGQRKVHKYSRCFTCYLICSLLLHISVYTCIYRYYVTFILYLEGDKFIYSLIYSLTT